MNIEFDGRSILSEGSFHDALAEALEFGPYYGGNLSALWDTLSTDVERPVRLVWKNSAASKAAMGASFDRVVNVLRRVEAEDSEMQYEAKFELVLA